MYKSFLILLSLFGWFLLTINKNSAFFEELMLALTFCIFFFAILQVANTFLFAYFVDRRNSIKLIYTKLFSRRKEAIHKLIEAYTVYKSFPEVSMNYYSTIYLRFNEKINLQILAEKEIIEASYKYLLKLICKVTS